MEQSNPGEDSTVRGRWRGDLWKYAGRDSCGSVERQARSPPGFHRVSEDERASEPGNRVDLQFNTTQGRRQVRKQLSPARRQRRDHAAMPAPHGADGPDGDPRCSGRRDDQPAHFGERAPVGNLAPGQHPSHAVPLQSGLILEGKKRTSRGVGNGRPRALLAVRPLCPAIARKPWSAAPPGELRDGPRGPPRTER